MDDDQFTYASLRKLERLENTQPRLQALEGQFWVRLGEHVAKIRKAFHEQQDEDPTNRRTVVLADELRNTYRLAESIWSLREKKVVQAALAASRRSEGRLDPPDNSTVEERHLWEETLKTLSSVRMDVLRTAMPRQGQPVEPTAIQKAATAAAGLQDAKVPAGPAASSVEEGTGPASAGSSPSSPTTPEVGSDPVREVVPVTPEAQVAQEGGAGRGSEADPGTTAPEAVAQAQAHEGGAGLGGDGEQEVELRLVAALKDVPMFTGLDMVDYELRAGEVGNVPANAAKILESRGLVRVLHDDTGPAIETSA